MKKFLTAATVFMAASVIAGCSQGSSTAQSSSPKESMSDAGSTNMSENKNSDSKTQNDKTAENSSVAGSASKTYVKADIPDVELTITYKDDKVLTISNRYIMKGYGSLGASNKEEAQKQADEMNAAAMKETAEGITIKMEVTDTGVVSATIFDVEKMSADPSGTLSDIGFDLNNNSFKSLDESLLSVGYTVK